MSSPKRARLSLLMAVVVLSWSAVAAGEMEPTEEARTHFERGRELEEQGDLISALGELERAFELAPSYRLRRHLGRVCRGIGRYTDAIAHFEAFLAGGAEAITPEQRRAIAQTIAETRAEVATLQISAPNGADLILDGAHLGAAPLAGPRNLDPGRHTVEVRLEGFREYQEVFTVTSGETRTLDVELEAVESAAVTPDEPTPIPTADIEERPPEARARAGIHRAVFWAGVGLAAALLTGGTVCGAMTISTWNEFDDLNVAERSNADHLRLVELQNDGEGYALAADVLLFSGAALAVAALVLAFFTDFDGADSSATPEARR